MARPAPAAGIHAFIPDEHLLQETNFPINRFPPKTRRNSLLRNALLRFAQPGDMR
jgi:hypothetical protein